MNKVFLIGNLVADVERKSTQSGVSIANFRIAVKRDYKNKDGNYDSDFINCRAFRQTAESIGKYFMKGSRIAVMGKWVSDSYEGNDGKKHYTNECYVDSFDFCEGFKKPEEKKEPADVFGEELDDMFVEAPSDEELPF